MLKTELETSSLISSKNYRLFTRAGVLAGTIDLIRALRFGLSQPVFSPEPIRRLKRKAEESSDDEPNSKYRKTPNSVNSLSPSSDESFSPPEFSQLNLIQTRALIKFYTAIAQYRVAPQSEAGTWRPWL